MIKGIIEAHVPSKVKRSDIYELVKDTGQICIVDGKMMIHDDNDTWPVVSEEDAKLLVRTMFKNKEWQKILDDNMLTSIIKSYKTDPDLQRSQDDFKHEECLKVRNGIWSIKKEEIVERDDVAFNRAVDVTLTKELPEESEVFISFCNKVFGEDTVNEKKQVLYEMIGYCVSETAPIKVAVFMIGPANCGKSVILKFIQKVIGEKHVSNVSLSSFAKEFNVGEMSEKVINITGEVPSGPIPGGALDIFKGITGGDRMQINKKYGQPASSILGVKLLVAGNTLPIFKKVDGTDSLVERLHILVFDNVVQEEDRDFQLLDKLWHDRDVIVRYALKAVKEYEERGRHFLRLEDEKNMLKSLRQVANPIAHFMKEKIHKSEMSEVHISDVYEAYQQFALAEALPDLDRTTFRNLMISQPGVSVGKTKKRLGKKSPQVCFKGIELKNMYDNEQDTEM